MVKISWIPLLHQWLLLFLHLCSTSLVTTTLAVDTTTATTTKAMDGEPLQLVYAGLPRSGSHSLQAALHRLGYKACHGEDVSRNALGSHKAIADAVIDQDVDRLLDATAQLGYNATLELHAVFWREIRERRPHVKLIFSVRDDFHNWFQSLLTVYQVMAPTLRYPSFALPLHQKLQKVFVSHISKNLQVYPEQALEILLNPDTPRHYQMQRINYDFFVREARNIAANDPEHALLLDLKSGDGYPQLCAFLNIPETKCPQEPFPHLSDRKHLQHFLLVTRMTEVVLYAVPILLVLFLMRVLRWVLRRTVVLPFERKADRDDDDAKKKK